jgi:hypothetical protein
MGLLTISEIEKVEALMVQILNELKSNGNEIRKLNDKVEVIQRELSDIKSR